MDDPVEIVAQERAGRLRAPTGHELAEAAAGLTALCSAGWRIVLPAADDPHYVVFKADGWAIEHSAGCRNDGAMLECRLHRDLTDRCDGPPAQGLGRYRTEPLDHGWHLIPADPTVGSTALLYVEEWTP